MATYRQAASFVPQFVDTNGTPLTGGTLEAYLAGTTTATAMYTDNIGTSAGAVITLNARGEPEVSGNTVLVWVDETIDYKFVLKDALGASIWTVDDINTGNATSSADVAFLAESGDAVERSVQNKLREYISITDFMTEAQRLDVINNTGLVDVTDARIAAQSATLNTRNLLIPAGTYFTADDGKTNVVKSDFIWFRGGFNTGVDILDSASKNQMLITTETDATSPYDEEKQKNGLVCTTISQGSQYSATARFNLTNSSDNLQGPTAVYARANSEPGDFKTFCLHAETRVGGDGGNVIGVSSENATYTTDGIVWGIVINNTTTGAGATHPTTGAAAVDHPDTEALYIQGARSTDESGAWKFGIRFGAQSIKTSASVNGAGECIRFDSPCDYLLHSTNGAIAETADILLEANGKAGIILNASYTDSAIKINSGENIALENTGSVNLYYDSGGNRINF